MGANIKIDGHCAIIEGGSKLHGAKVCATDLRGGAAVVMAGLVAEGKTEVSNIYHVERGYDHFEDKLRALGGKITRIEE